MKVRVNIKKLEQYLGKYCPEKGYATKKYIQHLSTIFGCNPEVEIKPDPESPKWRVILEPKPLIEALQRVKRDFQDSDYNFWFIVLEDTDSPFASALLQCAVNSSR